MSLRFFTDHCVPNSVIQALRDAGYEIFILKEHIPRSSDDPVVIAKAQELNTILVSLNGDFADIVTYPPSNYKGIIALQVRNRPQVVPVLMQRLTKYLLAHPEMSNYKGRLFLVEAHRIRIRK
jgi:predicted nuclease of predicted toxin-antitoxin system